MKKSLRVPLKVLLIVGAVLLAARIALPFVVLDVINDNMAEMGDYRGEVEDISISLWRGAYRIHDLSIRKVHGETYVPFVIIPEADISMSWRPLFRKRVLAVKVHLLEPTLNLVDSEVEEDRQFGEDVDWLEAINDIVQVDLDEVHIENGTVAFRNFNSDPQVDISISNIHATVTNLTTAEPKEGTRVAHLEGTADVLGHAPLEIAANFNPLVNVDDFNIRLRISDLDLKTLNDFTSAYARFDFQDGEGELLVEVEAREGQLDGYIKPLLSDVRIFDLEEQIEDEEKGFLRGMWEAFLHGVQKILKNPETGQLAGRVELSGSLDEPDISRWQAFVSILRNGFVEAFTPRFERDFPDPDDEEE
jgi:hypothetical protein